MHVVERAVGVENEGERFHEDSCDVNAPAFCARSASIWGASYGPARPNTSLDLRTGLFDRNQPPPLADGAGSYHIDRIPGGTEALDAFRRGKTAGGGGPGPLAFLRPGMKKNHKKGG